MPMIKPKLKYWKPHFLSFSYVPEYGGYRIECDSDDLDVEQEIRSLEVNKPVRYRELEPCVYACLEMCSNLIVRYNDRIRHVKIMFTNMSAEAESLCKSRIEPGSIEYYRLTDLNRELREIPEHINHLESSRNVAVAIRDEARDMARELLQTSKS